MNMGLVPTAMVICASLVCTTSGRNVNTNLDAKVGQVCADLINTDLTLIGSFARLAFHDCVGGCDGCLNTTLPPNFGLENAIVSLRPAYQKKVKNLGVSQADFWAKCGQVAAEAGRRNALGQTFSRYKDLPIEMRYGRKDCNGEPKERLELFPNAHWGLKKLLDWCTEQFSMSRRQCVALMGGHTLGRATTGWKGQWTEGLEAFAPNNRYYKNMLANNWTQTNVGEPGGLQFWQYESGNLMMLNCDMAMSKKITPNDLGRAQSSTASLKSAPTAFLVRMYAENNRLWLKDFGKAFTKMIETGVTVRPIKGGPAEIPDITMSKALPTTKSPPRIYGFKLGFSEI